MGLAKDIVVLSEFVCSHKTLGTDFGGFVERDLCWDHGSSRVKFKFYDKDRKSNSLAN
jgi:hypothetical protein